MKYGLLTSHDPSAPGGIREERTFTCLHCNSLHKVPEKCKPEDAGGFCRQCMEMICPSCVGKPCTPFLKKIEAAEARAIRLRQNGW